MYYRHKKEKQVYKIYTIRNISNLKVHDLEFLIRDLSNRTDLDKFRSAVRYSWAVFMS